MNPTDRFITRKRILQLAAAAGSHGLTPSYLLASLQTTGPSCNAAELATEISYLCDKALLTPITQTISPELPRYRITALGQDWLATQGAA